MLSLIRRHVIIEDIDNDWDCIYGQYIMHVELEWEIGLFERFIDIENYLIKYHNYDRFDYRDKFQIVDILNENGRVNLPINRPNEYLDDGETQVRFIVVNKD